MLVVIYFTHLRLMYEKYKSIFGQLTKLFMVNYNISFDLGKFNSLMFNSLMFLYRQFQYPSGKILAFNVRGPGFISIHNFAYMNRDMTGIKHFLFCLVFVIFA